MPSGHGIAVHEPSRRATEWSAAYASRSGCQSRWSGAKLSHVPTAGRNSLVGLDPLTGKVVASAATLGAAGLYAVSDGVALGLDEGALGDAWGYRLSARRVTWTAKDVPWPHFFVDLSGIGGSVAPDGSSVVLASCARLGRAASSGAPVPCLRPELVAVGP